MFRPCAIGESRPYGLTERDESRPYGFLTPKHSIFKLIAIGCQTPCFGTFSQQKVCKPLTIYLVFLELDDMISTG